ncbi:solute carrier family 49 member 4 homolog isoform X2 [Dreissena polymorpha]|uniref:solute carrier family 49 member 4 homolog isoform X2 n=1 Tax=Dreissena polymorpha TaxID=45954 RepID=UPI002263C8FD|nr:solute carrier family 49 member 4 homolog isoform X2 [Dreissena polymorpha]
MEEKKEERQPLLVSGEFKDNDLLVPDTETLLPDSLDTITGVYRCRWYIIILFSYGSFIQSVGWNTWGPITESAEVTFQWSDSDIGQLVNYANIAFILTVLPFCYLIDVKGIRFTVLICGLLNFVGFAVRCVSMEPGVMTWTANAGAIILGVGGTIGFAAPAKVSSVWFPSDQRATATSIASLSNFLGVSLSFLLGPLIVPSPKYACNDTNINNSTWSHVHHYGHIWEHNETNCINKVLINKEHLVTEIRYLMYLHAAGGLLFVLLALIYFPNKPPKPPSPTAAIARTQWTQGIKSIFRNHAFWLVVVAGSISSGVLGVWATVLDVNLKPLGITQLQAGYMGFWNTIAGCIAGFIMARFSDIFMRRMKAFLILLFSGAIISVVWFTAICNKYIPFDVVSLYASCILIGIFINASIPLFYEICAEASYPVSEGISGGILTQVNQLFGSCFLLVMLVKNIGVGWMNWALLGSSVVALPLLFLFPERYPRTDLDIVIEHRSSTADIQASENSEKLDPS